MNKGAILILLLVTARVSAWSQGSCELTADQSPAIRGFRLGMTLDQLYELVPEARNDKRVIEALDNSSRQQLPSMSFLTLSDSPYDALPRFHNVSYVSLRFLNNQLAGLTVQYKWPVWDSANEFIAKLRESLALPAAENWDGGGPGKSIRCKDFTLNVYTQPNGTGASISINDTTSPRKLDDMRKAVIERARKEFKP
jgi:hypothetical protein